MWSLFGLFASTLYHSARFARRGAFREEETYVGWTKVFYTPVVAAVLVLAIAEGLLNVSTIAGRVWMVPLFGVLAGFSSRKAAKLLSAVSRWSIGRLADSLQVPRKASTPAPRRMPTEAIVPPETFDHLGEQLKATAGAMLATKLNADPSKA